MFYAEIGNVLFRKTSENMIFMKIYSREIPEDREPNIHITKLESFLVILLVL